LFHQRENHAAKAWTVETNVFQRYNTFPGRVVFRWRSISRKGTAARSRAFGRARYLPQRKNIKPGACRAITGTAGEVPYPPLRSPSRIERIDSTRASWHASCRQEQMFLPLGQRSPNVPRHATRSLSFSLAPRVCFSVHPEGFSRAAGEAPALGASRPNL